MKRRIYLLSIAILLLSLTACAPTTAGQPDATVPPPVVEAGTQPTLPPATPLPQATALPEATALAEATALPEATAIPAATALPEATVLPEPAAEPALLIVSGVTEEGAYFYGNPDAPVTFIDYSDFL